MADPTLVNGQVTDAVAQAGVVALASAPANALATGYQTGAHAIGLAMQNAVANQQHTTTLSGSAATQAVSQMLTMAPSQTARATVETLTGQALASELISLSAAIRAKPRTNGTPPQPPSPPRPPPPSPPQPPPHPLTPELHSIATPDLAAMGQALIDAIRQLADAIRKLAQTRTGEYRMSDLDALEAIRRSADRLNTLLEELAKQMAAGPPADLWRRLCDALDELRRATRFLEDRGRPGWCPPIAPPVPVGATPPGVVIVGSGNTHTPPPRVVGASW